MSTGKRRKARDLRLAGDPGAGWGASARQAANL